MMAMDRNGQILRSSSQLGPHLSTSSACWMNNPNIGTPHIFSWLVHKSEMRLDFCDGACGNCCTRYRRPVAQEVGDYFGCLDIKDCNPFRLQESYTTDTAQMSHPTYSCHFALVLCIDSQYTAWISQSEFMMNGQKAWTESQENLTTLIMHRNKMHL